MKRTKIKKISFILLIFIVIVFFVTSNIFAAYPTLSAAYKVIIGNSSHQYTKSISIDLSDGVYVTENPSTRYYCTEDVDNKTWNSIAPPTGTKLTWYKSSSGYRTWVSQGGSVSGGWNNYSKSVINLNTVDVTGTTPYIRLPRVAKAGHTFTGWSITERQTAYYYYRGWKSTSGGGSIGNSGGWYNIETGMTSNIKTVKPTFTKNNYYLDVNGMLDGTSSGGVSGYGTFDVYINGSLVANDVADYYTAHPYGSTYSITDIKAKTGKQYNGVYSGAISGTIDGTKSTSLKFSTISYSNTIGHWAWGYKKGEGDNGTKNAKNIANTSFSSSYGSTFNMGTTRAVSIPKGFYLQNTFGTANINGTWTAYSMGTNVVQKPNSMSFEYDYVPYDYSIIYNLTGGTITGQPTSYTVLYDEKIPNPIKKGYEFLGWTGSNGITPQKNLTIPVGSTENKNYTANWKQVEFNITFNTMGGTPIASMTVGPNNTIPIPNPPTRNGYMFDGWYSYSDYKNLWDFNTIITNHTTLYAKWIPNPTIIANNRYFLEDEIFTETDLIQNIIISCEDQNFDVTISGFKNDMIGNIGEYDLTVFINFSNRNEIFEKDFKVYIVKTPTEEYLRSVSIDALYTITSSSVLFEKLDLLSTNISNNNPIRSFIITKK